MASIRTAGLLFSLALTLTCKPARQPPRTEGEFFGPPIVTVEALARNRYVPGQPVLMWLSAERWNALTKDIPTTAGTLPKECSGILGVPVPTLREVPAGLAIEPPRGVQVTIPCVGPAPGDPTKSCFPRFRRLPGGGFAVAGCICLDNDEGNTPGPQVGVEPFPTACHLVVWPDSVRCRGTCSNGGRCALIRSFVGRDSVSLSTAFIGCACLPPVPAD